MSFFDLNSAPSQDIIQIRYADATEVFEAARLRWAAMGFESPEIDGSGQIQRFSKKNKPGAKNLWYVAFSDHIPVIIYGDWTTGETWQISGTDEDIARAFTAKSVPRDYLEELERRMAQVREEREAESRRIDAEVVSRCKEDIERCLPLTNEHPYAANKRLGDGAALGGAVLDGTSILIPLFTVEGKFGGYQRILQDGTKLFPTGLRKKGRFAWINCSDHSTVLICEGWATGVSLRQATDYPVVVALDAGNLLEVTPLIREKVQKDIKIIICADNDQWTKNSRGEPINPGREKAAEAARLIGATYVYPVFRDDSTHPTDFNDLAVLEGLPQVAKIIRAGRGGVPRITQWGIDPLYTGTAPEQEWLVDGMVPMNAPSILVASGGTGKGMLTLDLALQIADTREHGFLSLNGEENWLGAKVLTHGAVVILTAEDSKDDVHRRLDAIDPTGERRLAAAGRLFPVALPDCSGPITIVADGGRGKGYCLTAEYEELMHQLEQIHDLACVVLDPLASFVAVDINADPQAGQYVQGALARMSQQCGCAVITCHHMGKSIKQVNSAQAARDSIRGTTALVDGVRCAIAIWPADESTAKELADALGEDVAPASKCFCAAVVKSNSLADQRVRTLVRGKDGLLRAVDVSQTRKKGDEELIQTVVDVIADAATNGHPFTKSGSAGVWDRRNEFGTKISRMTRAEIWKLIDACIASGKVVKCSIKKSTARYLDVPDGELAINGENYEFSSGAIHIIKE